MKRTRTITTEGLCAAAHLWWKHHRPLDWSLGEHLENSTINCTFFEKQLARAVVRYLEARRGVRLTGKVGKGRKR